MKKFILTGLMSLMVISVSALPVYDGPTYNNREGENCHIKNGDGYENGKVQHFSDRAQDESKKDTDFDGGGKAGVNAGIFEVSGGGNASTSNGTRSETERIRSGYECKTSSGYHDVYYDGHVDKDGNPIGKW